MRRTIREKEPARPSTRVSTLRGDELTTTAKRRGLEPPKLISLLRGDLDWIVMKCLEKDRSRRYETANGLARDIERHLGNEPVTAGPPGARYKIGKFVRRNKWLMVASTCVLAVLTLGILASVREARQQSRLRQQAQKAQANEARERVKAQTEAAKSDQVAQFLTDMLAGVGPSVALGRDTTILKEILDKTAERVGNELTNQPEVAIEVLKTLANTYHELGLYPQMEKMATEGLRLARTALPEQNLELGRTLQVVAMAQWEQGRYEEAERSQREGLAYQRKVLGNQDAEVGTSLNSLGLVLESRGKFAEAEAMFREAVAIWRKSRGEDIDLANNLSNLGMALRKQGKLLEAEAVRREALAIDQKLLGGEHPDVAASLHDLATVLRDEGKLAEAEAMFRDALALQRKVLGQEHPLVALTLHNLSQTLVEEGKMAEAESSSRQALAMFRKVLGNEHPHTASALSGLAFILAQERKLDEAESVYREALGMQRKQLGEEHPEVAATLETMAQMLQDQGKLAEAEAAAREAVTINSKVLGAEDPEIASGQHLLASILVEAAKKSQAGDFSEAESLMRRCLVLKEKKLPDDWRTFTAQNLLGGILMLEKRYAEAEPLLLSGYNGMKQREKKIPAEGREFKGAIGGLVQLYESTGRPDQAAEWKKRLDEFEQSATPSQPASDAAAKPAP
jgi:tetratricopeptide (TPR) repeat protein